MSCSADRQEFGDCRPFEPLSALTLYGANDQPGGLTATYTSRKEPALVRVQRTENKIDYEFLESLQQLPSGFSLQDGLVRYEGAIASAFNGEHKFLMSAGGYIKVWLDGKPLDLAPGEAPDGPAQLFLRPHDVDVVDDESGAISGEVKVLRRHAGLRRVDLDVGAERNRIEIELPADLNLNPARSIAFRPRRYRLYPTSQALDS